MNLVNILWKVTHIKKSQKVVSMLLALSMVTALLIPASAAEPMEQQPEVMVSINEAGETVYPQTFSNCLRCSQFRNPSLK